MPRVTWMTSACLCLCALGVGNAIAAGPAKALSVSDSSSGTDFDAYTRDQLERHEPHVRRPAGWVGAWPPPSHEDRMFREAQEAVPGGGDVPLDGPAPLLVTDNAVPPAGVDVHIEVPAPAPSAGPESPPPAKPKPATTTKRSAGSKPRATDSGPYTSSTGYEHEPARLYTRVGVVTLIEFKNGERPVDGGFCGDCAVVTPDGKVSEEGRFIVERMADKVSVRPREASDEPGAFLTNLHIVTDTGRTITFDLYEASAGMEPTQRHEIRASRDEGSLINPGLVAQVSSASKAVEEHLRKDLEARERTIVAEKASRRMDGYTDAKVEKKAAGRRLEIEAASTIGDETVIRMRVDATPADVADPVAFLKADGRVRALKTRSILRQPEGSSLVITLSVEGVVLGEDQRIAVSMMDKRSGEELRSSVGRG